MQLGAWRRAWGPRKSVTWKETVHDRASHSIFDPMRMGGSEEDSTIGLGRNRFITNPRGCIIRASVRLASRASEGGRCGKNSI